MAWLKIDDSFDDHPKTLKLSPSAITLHIRALCWCNRHLTDGVIPPQAIERLTIGLEAPASVVLELVEGEQWKQDNENWIIHDYLEYNPSRKDTMKKRKQKAIAGTQGGRKSGLSRRSKTEAKSKHSGSQKSNSRPVPSRPDPVPNFKEIKSPPTPQKERGAPSEFLPDPEPFESYPRHNGFKHISAAYPEKRRNTRCVEAEGIYLERNPTPEIDHAILAGIKAWKSDEQWRREGGRYVPSLYNFIRDKMWESLPEQKSGAANWSPPEERGKS